jgi:hypothetical protein
LMPVHTEVPLASGEPNANDREHAVTAPTPKPMLPEIGGPPGPEPTRYGDWEKGGHCIDF